MNPGSEKRNAKGNLKSRLQECFPCTNCWSGRTDELELENKNPGVTGPAISNCNDHEMRNKGLNLNEASTSNCHLGQSSQEGIPKISDAIHIFYEPEPTDKASLDVFFFHGLECEFEGAHVRDAHIAENLLQEITWAREGRGYTPIVLVGHGFGGIVMKTLCIKAQSSVDNKDMDMFLGSVRGFFFYATPHLGMKGMKPPTANEGPLVRWMRMLDSEAARLNEAFTKLWRARRYRWTIFGLGENESTPGKHGLQVPEASSRFGDNYITVSGDHFSVCRPSDKRSNKYQHLTHLIRDVQRQAEVEKNPPLLVPEQTVGVDAFINEILVKHMRDHRFLGFSGMGGVGKTTVAKLIFNSICAKFEFSCFVEEIKQLPGTKDEVKSRIWEKMRWRGLPIHSSIGSSGEDEWSQMIGKSLFLVFDDVEDPMHVTLLNEIAQENRMEESRFVLTSRNAQRVLDCGYDVEPIRVDFLGNQDAKKLFNAYAFPGLGEAPEEFRELVEQVVDGCEGLPLTLEVLGKYLRGKSFELWAEIPVALRKCDEVADLEEKVWVKLRLSYDGLPSSEVRSMFLDVASFFVGVDVFTASDAIMAWSALYEGIAFNRLEILENRALVTVRHVKDHLGQDQKQFYMHEHLRRMGERIARLEGRSFDLSRIWSLSTSFRNRGERVQMYPYDTHVVFQGDQELGKIVAHRVEITPHSLSICAQTCAFCIMREVWPRLTTIRYMEILLQISSCCDECKVRKVALPSTLVLLRLSLLSRFNGDLDIVFSVVEAGRNYIDDIRSTLSLAGCASLVKLDLSYCHNVDLGGLNELRCMRDLRISDCNAVQNWPASLKELRNLERLELRCIGEEFSLPTTFLDVDEISGRQTIPNILGPLRQLQVLRMKYTCWANHNVAELEDAVRDVALRTLDLKCKGMFELPDTLGNLTNLQELSFLSPIRSLPKSVSNLMQLKCVNMRGDCWTVSNMLDSRFALRQAFQGRSVWGGECRVNLKDGDEAVLEVLQPLHGFMTKQTGLNLRCTRGPSAVLVRNMVDLESLTIEVDGKISTDAVAAVPDIFGDLHKLRRFELTCTAVENSLVESLRFLSALETLSLECETVEQLPLLFGCFSTLESLRLRCPSLQALPIITGDFIKLKQVYIYDTGLRSFPSSFTKLSNLKSLSLRNLQKLEALPEAIGNLHSLDSLNIKDCAVESLPESLGRLSGLDNLCVTSCKNLKTLPETIGDLCSLTSLDLSGSFLHSVPKSLGSLSGLISLAVKNCENLKTLPETIGDLTSLTFLDISGSALHPLPERLVQLPGLRIFS
ncbi:hypothetical protein R1sor_010202 [Riccia sorocarpa]|uniref:NB-ARC domain-containing protein n=1 Tax=Riccia sorocarpa TaxID=122646 RepID=A0ABD3HYW3_9MARC